MPDHTRTRLENIDPRMPIGKLYQFPDIYALFKEENLVSL